MRAAVELAEEIGVKARFVTADIYDAPEALGGSTFDIVYTGVRALRAAGCGALGEGGLSSAPAGQ